jgi:hypothetical protein
MPKFTGLLRKAESQKSDFLFAESQKNDEIWGLLSNFSTK